MQDGPAETNLDEIRALLAELPGPDHAAAAAVGAHGRAGAGTGTVAVAGRALCVGGEEQGGRDALHRVDEVDGEVRQSDRGKALRHPFTGVALALECGIPDPVCHIIATHAAEGDLVKRTTEAYIVHHADFMSFLPFKNLAG